jgi:hypothetical protein
MGSYGLWLTGLRQAGFDIGDRRIRFTAKRRAEKQQENNNIQCECLGPQKGGANLQYSKRLATWLTLSAI